MAAEIGVPLLMLAAKEENPQVREFWDLSKGVTYTMNFPELTGKSCFYGVGIPDWFFTADEQGHMNLFHLFSRTIINLPDINMLEGFDYEEKLGCDRANYVHKALISSDPLSTDYVLALIQGYPRTFAFWRPGNRSFTSLGKIIPRCAYSDFNWKDGKFYCVNYLGNVVILDFRSSQKDYYPTTAKVIKSQIPRKIACSNIIYIVHSMGELLVINRDGTCCVEWDMDTGICDSYGVKQFHVYKVNEVDNRYEEVKDLGNRALFVGSSATLAVEQSCHHQIKGNHIYFTDNCKEGYFFNKKGGGKDMGIYNLGDGSIVPHYPGQSYHKVTPPLWVFSKLNLD